MKPWLCLCLSLEVWSKHNIAMGFLCSAEGQRVWVLRSAKVNRNFLGFFFLFVFHCQLFCLLGKLASCTHGVFCCLGSCVCILTKCWNQTRVCIRKGSVRVQQDAAVFSVSSFVLGCHWVPCRVPNWTKLKVPLLFSTDPTIRQQRPAAKMNATLLFGEVWLGVLFRYQSLQCRE